MATLTPFKALRYNPAKVRDLGVAVAPPYDIISPKEQEFYYDLNPYNVIRLDFGKSMGSDDAKTNKYSRAAKQLQLWREQGILTQDPKPAIYLASQDYVSPAGKKMTFTGVYALLKLEDYKTGVVKPHEKTLSKPKADRLELTKATQSNFSPIFFLFDDKGSKAAKWMAAQMKKKPTVTFKTPSGEKNCVWVVSEPKAIKAFTGLHARQPVYIADGHHRYETMLRYSKEAPKPVKAAAAQTLACFTPFQNPGLIILPTHRLVHGLKGFGEGKLRQSLAEDFEVKAQPNLAALEKVMAVADKAAAKAKAGKEPHVFGLVLPNGLYSLTLKPAVDPLKVMKDKRSAAYKRLDVSLLQALVLEKVLGMTPESIAAQEGLFFEKGAAKTAAAVQSGQAQAGFLLNPTRMDQLKDVSDAKDVMPQKSTFFQPKLITGAILRSMA
jgi:uncharacterized protein (DUF1015 family)